MNIASGEPGGGGGGDTRFKSTIREKAIKRKPSRPPAMLAAIFMFVSPFLFLSPWLGIPFFDSSVYSRAVSLMRRYLLIAAVLNSWAGTLTVATPRLRRPRKVRW